jgi:uncharacterized protein (DUF433 family)
MLAEADHLIGVGLYGVPEAHRLTGAKPSTIYRWLSGYRYRRDGAERFSPPVWNGDFGQVDGQLTLSFQDLMEVRFVRAFRQHGVSWPAIREAAAIACEMFQSSHPFSRHRFRTDGGRIFEEVESRGAVKLFDLNRQSWVFHDIVSPSLYQGIEFEADHAVRWFPMHPRKSIVLDPAFSFGRPIVARERVPTEVLALAAKAEGSIEAVARWFGVSPSAVRVAVEFEERAGA